MHILEEIRHMEREVLGLYESLIALQCQSFEKMESQFRNKVTLRVKEIEDRAEKIEAKIDEKYFSRTA